LAWRVCGLDLTGSGQGPVVGCCGSGDEPLGSCATELVSYVNYEMIHHSTIVHCEVQ
jgi:hypothetical protein